VKELVDGSEIEFDDLGTHDTTQFGPRVTGG
jgi:hypothetical protein